MLRILHRSVKVRQDSAQCTSYTGLHQRTFVGGRDSFQQYHLPAFPRPGLWGLQESQVPVWLKYKKSQIARDMGYIVLYLKMWWSFLLTILIPQRDLKMNWVLVCYFSLMVPLYAFLMSTMALEILSLVMFIPFYLGNILSLSSGTCGPLSHLSTSYPPLHPDLKRKKRKTTCVPLSFVKTLWYHLVYVNVTGWCTDGHKRTFVKSGECYSTETLISSPLLWSCLENNYE